MDIVTKNKVSFFTFIINNSNPSNFENKKYFKLFIVIVLSQYEGKNEIFEKVTFIFFKIHLF